jgi:DNA polymerase-3 subunit epsilon
MYLFFDTETTGLPINWKAPITDINNWPRLVQLAYLIYDQNGNQIAEKNFIIKPQGFNIPLEASRIHKISTARAHEEGIDLQEALDDFQNAINQAEFLVAHNMSFDEKIIRTEFLRNAMIDNIAAKKKICTMESTTNFCAIKGHYGYKWPKLSELHYKLFQTDFEEAHNATFDILATAKCFWELRRLQKI